MRNGCRSVALSAALLAGVALTGCRGSSQSPTVTPSAPASGTTTGTPATASPVATATSTPAPARSEAEALLHAGDYEGASEAYTAIARDASSGDERTAALLGLAVARKASGDLDGALTAASQAVDAAGAVGETAVRAAYLRGRYLADNGRYTEAVEALVPLAGEGAGVLQPFVLADLQRAALGAGDEALAESTAARLALEPNVHSGLRDGAQRSNVLAALRSGDPERYAAELEQLVSISGYARDRFDLAEAYRKLGRDADRLDQLRLIVNRSPSDALAVAAMEGLKESGETINPLLEGFIYYRGRRYVEAEAVLAPAVADRASLSPADQSFATYYLAAALEDQGNLADAIELYDQVPGLDPGTPYAHRARYWAARVVESLEEFSSASARYVELANAGPAGEFTEEASFRAGYVLYSLGDPAGAVGAWAALATADARVLFWRGMAERQLGDETAAAASFAAAIAEGPLDFHGVEAARMSGQLGALDVSYRERDLGAPVHWDAIEAWLAAIAPREPAGLPTTAASALAALGLRSEAEDTLLAAASGNVSPWLVLAAAREAYDLGLRSTAARLGDRLRYEHGVAWEDAPPALLGLAYPVDFPALLDAEARRVGLDPLFLAALVRIESYWQPAAVSPVGALGLTQVMPATGEAIAAALGVEGFTVDSLLRPATSLRFGAFYIAEQIDTFGQPFIALAAYNGGPGRAARWANAWDGQSAASFAEAVDIDETRNYVELVLEAYARYDAAYPVLAR